MKKTKNFARPRPLAIPRGVKLGGSSFLPELGGCDDMSISISLSTDGNDIFIKRSRELEADEIPCLLRRGSAKERKTKRKRRNKWSVFYDTNPTFDRNSGRFFLNDVSWKWFKKINENGKTFAKIRKAGHSKYYIPLEEGRTRKVCFGIGIYKDFGAGRLKRVSNICYFRSNVRATADGEFEQWLSV